MPENTGEFSPSRTGGFETEFKIVYDWNEPLQERAVGVFDRFLFFAGSALLVILEIGLSCAGPDRENDRDPPASVSPSSSSRDEPAAAPDDAADFRSAVGCCRPQPVIQLPEFFSCLANSDQSDVVILRLRSNEAPQLVDQTL